VSWPKTPSDLPTVSFCPFHRALALDVALDLTRSKSELLIENALLRQQLAVLNRQVKRPQLTWRDRSIIVFLSSKLRGRKDAVMIVQPETILRWHRDVFRFVWRRKSKAESKPRPPLSDDDIARIKRMARENATWGAERIRGELMQESHSSPSPSEDRAAHTMSDRATRVTTHKRDSCFSSGAQRAASHLLLDGSRKRWTRSGPTPCLSLTDNSFTNSSSASGSPPTGLIRCAG
jgi:hypothetical protein